MSAIEIQHSTGSSSTSIEESPQWKMFRDESLSRPLTITLHNDFIVAEVDVLSTKDEDGSFVRKLPLELRFYFLQPPHTEKSNLKEGKEEAPRKEPLGIYLEPSDYANHLRLYSDQPLVLQQLDEVLVQKSTAPNFHRLYRAIRKIGKGTSATVYLGQRLNDGMEVAVKAFPKETMMTDPRGRDAIENEIEVLRQLRHKRLLNLLEVFQTKNTIYLCTEYLKGGQLFQRIMNSKISLLQIQSYLRQLLEALVAMKQQAIIHRDIKPENIVFREENSEELVLADFGLATFQSAKEYIYLRCGTPGFAAPEILACRPGSRQKCISDVFSVGILIYFMVFRKLPYQGTTVDEITRKNRKCEFSFPENLREKMDGHLLDLMLLMIEADPEKRITPELALNHIFFSRSYTDKSCIFSETEPKLSENTTHVSRIQKTNLLRITDSLGSFNMAKAICMREHDSESEMGSLQNASIVCPNSPRTVTPETQAGTPTNIKDNNRFSACSVAKSKYFSEGLPKKKAHLQAYAKKKVQIEEFHEN